MVPQVVTAATPLNQQAGYYCKVCDCILRDSQSYLDHMCAAAGPLTLTPFLPPYRLSGRKCVRMSAMVLQIAIRLFRK